MRLSFRWKLLLALGATTVVAVAVVAFVATRLVRASFLRSDRERIQEVLGQAQASIQHRGELAARRVTAVSESEAATRIAIALNQSAQGNAGPGDFPGGSGYAGTGTRIGSAAADCGGRNDPFLGPMASPRRLP